MKRLIFEDKAALAKEFYILLERLVTENKVVHVALSGGSTPKAIFDYIVKSSLATIDWKKVHLYWGDERCVSPQSDESNYKMTKDHLLDHIKIPKGNVHRIRGENKPDYEAKRYANHIKKTVPDQNKIPQFDLLILGMGEDGHTASIFPHEMDLWKARKNCVVANHPESGQKRISMTGRVINNAKQVVFLVTGDNKKQRVREIFNKDEIAEKYPAFFVKPLSQKLVWFLDEDAASLIS